MSFAAALNNFDRLSLVALFTAAVGSAAAQGDRRPMLPTRDTAITYRVLGLPAEVEEMRVSWLASESRQRIDWPGSSRVTVVDHRKPGTSFAVYDGARTVFMLRAGEEPTIGALSDPEATGRYARAGTASYAGQACTVWRREEGRSTHEACIADDGTMLRSVVALEYEGHTQTGGLGATRVDHGPQDPARFRPPEGYRVVWRSAAPPPTALGR